MLRMLVLVILVLGLLYLIRPVTQDAKHTDSIQQRHQASKLAVEAKKTPSMASQREHNAAKIHIEQLTASPAKPIDVRHAQHFVTDSQLLQLPPTHTQNTVTLATLNSRPNAKSNAHSFGVTMRPFNPQTGTSTPHTAPNKPLNTDTFKTNQVQLKELITPSDSAEKRIFYIHAVNPSDDQGLWGILQSGLTSTFAQGIHVSSHHEPLTAHIPDAADEVLTNQRSSYLGKLLHEKAQTTYVYNYQQGLIGQNPHLIHPGQQLIIVTFTEPELMQIYQHFHTP